MDFLALMHALSHAVSSIQLDDSSVSVLAMLCGIVGGWTLTGFLQPKTKKVKAERKDGSKRPPR